MNNNFHKIILILSISYSHFIIAQEAINFEAGYEIYKIYPSLSISQDELKEIQTLENLNRYYNSEWVREYMNVTISAHHNNSLKKAKSKSLLLTEEQKDLIKKADVNSEISVYIKYIPENTLVENDPKEISYSFTVDPDQDAMFPGGEKKMKAYIKKNITDKLSKDRFDEYGMSVIQFSINEDGEVVDAHIYDSSAYTKTEDKKRDDILLEAICQMPTWQAAQYKNGLKVRQNFILSAGDQRSCVLNLFNTHLLN